MSSTTVPNPANGSFPSRSSRLSAGCMWLHGTSLLQKHNSRCHFDHKNHLMLATFLRKVWFCMHFLRLLTFALLQFRRNWPIGLFWGLCTSFSSDALCRCLSDGLCLCLLVMPFPGGWPAGQGLQCTFWVGAITPPYIYATISNIKKLQHNFPKMMGPFVIFPKIYPIWCSYPFLK